MWLVEKIEISGGFLPGLSVSIPRGLTCIIGARGSGKSTLAEAVRFPSLIVRGRLSKDTPQLGFAAL